MSQPLKNRDWFNRRITPEEAKDFVLHIRNKNAAKTEDNVLPDVTILAKNAEVNSNLKLVREKYGITENDLPKLYDWANKNNDKEALADYDRAINSLTEKQQMDILPVQSIEKGTEEERDRAEYAKGISNAAENSMFINPIGVLAKQSVEGIKEGLDKIGGGNVLGAITGVKDIAFSIANATGLGIINTGVQAGLETAQAVLGQEAAEWITQPVSKIIKPENATEKYAAELGDLAVQVAIPLAIHSGLGKLKLKEIIQTGTKAEKIQAIKDLRNLNENRQSSQKVNKETTQGTESIGQVPVEQTAKGATGIERTGPDLKKEIAKTGENQIAPVQKVGKQAEITGPKIAGGIFKGWLENQPDVTLEHKKNLGVTGEGDIAGAYTQKTGEGFKVSYADYTPETSFAKEIGRVLSNKLDVETLKSLEGEYKNLGFEKGLPSDKFSSSVKELITNPELKEKAPGLTKLLEDQKVPFEKMETEIKSPIPEFPRTETQRKKISAEFESTIKDKSHFNSFKKMTSDSELNQYLDEVGKGVDKSRGVMTENVVNDLAATLGITNKDILKLRKGETRNVEQLTGMKQVLVDNLGGIAKIVKEGGDKLSPENATQLKDMMLTHNAMQAKIMGAVSESARVLQSMNRKVDPREFDILSKAYGKLKETGADIDKPEVLGKKLKELSDPTLGDKAVFWWYQSLLFNPYTDVANITGNSTYAITETLSRAAFEPQNIGAMLKGTKAGWKDFVKEVQEIYAGEKKELSKFDWDKKELSKVYDPSPLNVQNALLKKLAGVGHILLPTNRLKVEDAFFRNIAGNIEKEVGVKNLAKKGESKDIIREKLNSLEEVINNETKDIKDLTDTEKKYYQTIQDYHRYARELTFTEPLGQTGAYFQRLTNSNALLKWVFPFIRVSTNLVKEGLKHTPYYLGKAGMKEAYGQISGKNPEGRWTNLSSRQKTTMVRRAIAGTSVLTALEYLQAKGDVVITGDGPADRNKKELWLKSGYKPNHIYFGDKGIPYSNINPFGVLLAVRGNISDYSKYDTKFNKDDNSLDEKISLLFGKATNTMLAQSFMWGAQSLLESITKGDENLLAKIVSSPIPNIGGMIRTMKGDFTSYEKDSFWDTVESKLGTANLKPQVDIYGEDKQSGYRRFPFQATDKNTDKPMNFIVENNIHLGLPGRPKVKGEEATDEQFRKYKILSGQNLEKRLNKFYPIYSRMDAEKAEKFIRKLAEQEREKAKNILFGKRRKSYFD
jgi:hypothetical protein